jgi:hypothetical protein
MAANFFAQRKVKVLWPSGAVPIAIGTKARTPVRIWTGPRKKEAAGKKPQLAVRNGCQFFLFLMPIESGRRAAKKLLRL